MASTATIEQSGETATGIRIPMGVVDEVQGNRPRVVVTCAEGYSFRTTIGAHAARARPDDRCRRSSGTSMARRPHNEQQVSAETALTSCFAV